MGEYKDRRAVSLEFIQDLNDDNKLGEFTKFVRNNQAELQMCFRGNGEYEKVIIYKNNHAFWTITKNKAKKEDKRKYKVSISFNHARYSSRFSAVNVVSINGTYNFLSIEFPFYQKIDTFTF